MGESPPSVAVSQAAGTAEAQRPRPVLPQEDQVPKRFVARMHKGSRDRCGASLGSTPSGAVIVRIEEGGMFDRWNKLNPDQVLCPGFFIEEVNGQRGYWNVLEEMKGTGPMVFHIATEPPPSAGPEWFQWFENVNDLAFKQIEAPRRPPDAGAGAAEAAAASAELGFSGIKPACPAWPSSWELSAQLQRLEARQQAAPDPLKPWKQQPPRRDASVLWDPVWGEVQLAALARDETYERRLLKHSLAKACFALSPCCFVSLARFCVGAESEVRSGVSAGDARRGWRQVLSSWSFVLAMAQLVLFLIPMLAPDDGLTDYERFDKMGAKNAAKVLYDQEWWRLLTPIFLHVSWLHLLGNAFIQLRTALSLEVIWGRWRWLVIYLASAAFASLASCIASPHAQMVGSSGALTGVIGAWLPFIVLTWNQTLPQDVRRRNEMLALVSLSIVTLVAFSCLTPTVGLMPGVDWASHLGGLAMGAALGLLLFADRVQATAWRWAAAGGGFVGAVALAFGGCCHFLLYVHPPEELLLL